MSGYYAYRTPRTFARASSIANWRLTRTIRRTLTSPSPTRSWKITASPARLDRRNPHLPANLSKIIERNGAAGPSRIGISGTPALFGAILQQVPDDHVQHAQNQASPERGPQAAHLEAGHEYGRELQHKRVDQKPENAKG